MKQTYVAIDVETTGLDPYDDAIIEMAAVVFQGEEILEEWSSLVDPGRDLPPFITQLTGITSAMLHDAPGLFSLRGRLRRTLGGHVIVGHNVDFDLNFLAQAHIGTDQQHRVDTLTLASILLPGTGRYSLDALVRALDLPGGPQDHRALSDARQTVALFQSLYALACRLDYPILNEIVMAGQQLGWPETVFFEEALRAVGKGAFGQRERLSKLYHPPKPDGHTLNPRDELDPIDTEAATGMLRPGGNFDKTFPGYEYRPQQEEMVAAVAEAFNNGKHLIVEAGTGTGKSIGYLLPAAFWAHQNERCVVVSTNTINLQDQLIHKDLPELARLLPFKLNAALLKGKRNYLCTRLFQEMRHKGPANADEMTLYARVLVWLPGSSSGDVAEISLRTSGERMAWDRLSADNDGCRMDTCREERCPLHIARRRAERAHVLVVNHALLLADVATDNRVLPPYLDLIVDEAHHLEDAVTDGLSFRADKRFIQALLDEITRPRAGMLADVQTRARAAVPAEASQILDGYITDLRAAGQTATGRVDDFFATVDYFLQDYVRPGSQYSERIRLTPAVRAQPDWDQVTIAWDNLSKPLATISEALGKLSGGLAELMETYQIEDGEDLEIAVTSLARNLAETKANLDALVLEPDERMIYWIESFKNYISLHAAPLHVGPLVEEHIFKEKETVVLTSATLRTSGRGGYDNFSFDYLRDRLNAVHAEELAVGSPFDYANATLLYLITDIPEPRQPGYQRYVEEAIVDVARALGGRTMALFTSYSQLSATGRAIAQSLADADITLLSQAEGASRQQLLEQFKADDHAVLLGTRSFWEGVDVPGAALQAVMIAKLPFDVPSDPIFAARSETFESPFFEYSIPEAVLRFRQGFGRLIRRRDDEGIVVVLDKRVLTKRYGQAFLDALPECMVLRQRHERLGELALRWLNREKE